MAILKDKKVYQPNIQEQVNALQHQLDLLKAETKIRDVESGILTVKITKDGNKQERIEELLKAIQRLESL